MATTSKKNCREWSIRLCQRIVEREIENDFLDDIQEAISKGADINFRDSNRDNNTPLHLAIENRDRKCAEFLLKFNPELSVRNDDGDAAEDLAKNLECDEITKLLTQYSELKLCEVESEVIAVTVTEQEEKVKYPNYQRTSSFLTPFEQSSEICRENINININNIISYKDDRGYNSLMIAVENNQLGEVQNLLKYEFDLSLTGNDNKTAADIAWQLNNFECLAELISADSIFPKDFVISEELNDLNQRLFTAITEKSSFHDAIRSGSTEKVKQYINENPHIKFAYDSANKTALTTSVETKQFKIYSLLKSQGFDGCDELLLASLTQDEKRMIRETNKEFFKTSNLSHLFFLVSRTRLGFNVRNREYYFEIIGIMYQKLSEIPEILSILKCLESSQQLHIIFEFNKQHVMDLDPIATSYTTGMFYHKSGYIYVAAGNHEENFNRIIGTLAHELAHYAMQLIYENDCKPYTRNDECNEKVFDAISEALRQRCLIAPDETDEIISTVFECYPSHRCHAELIIRVPHLLAHYINDRDTLDNLKSSYCKDLFNFYANKCNIDIESQHSFIVPKKEIKKLNALVGLVEQVCESKIRLITAEIKQFETIFSDKNKILILSSNVPLIALMTCYQILLAKHDTAVDSSHIFVKNESLLNRELFSKVVDTFESKVAPYLIIDCENEAHSVVDLIEYNINKRTILITTLHGGVRLKERCQSSKSTVELKEFKINWHQLEESSQLNLLRRELIFQEHQMKLNQFTTPSSPLCEHLPLHDLLSNKMIIVNSSANNNLFSSRNFYINRYFVAQKVVENIEEQEEFGRRIPFTPTSSQHEDKKEEIISVQVNLNELLEEARTNKVMIISSTAGTGKTTSLKFISKLLKDQTTNQWISYINLKEHICTFDRFQKSHETPQSFPDFLEKHILKLSEKFEINLFQELFQQGKVVILFNGFDEISPNYKDFVLSLMKLFDIKLGNQMWITTRSYLRKCLEENLHQLAYSIAPLTKENQVEFLVEYWRTEVQVQENLHTMAASLIDKLSKVSIKSNNDLVGIPLLVRMIGEIHQTDLVSDESLNFYSIFDSFIDKIITKWMNKGEISRLEQSKIHKQSCSVAEIHRLIALKYIFGEEFSLDYNDREWSKEKISRMGIVCFETTNEDISFIHETFAEFFVAEFVACNLAERNKPVSQLLLKILTNEKYQMIRLFLDKALENHKLSKVSANFIETFKSNISMNNGYDILHNVVKEALESLLGILQNFLDCVKDLKFVETVLMNVTNENILASACVSRNISILNKVLTFSSQKLSQDNIRTLCYARNQDNKNLLSFVLESDETGESTTMLLKYLCEHLQEKFIKHLITQKTGRFLVNALSTAATTCCSKEVLKSFWCFVSKLLTFSEQKKLFYETNTTFGNPIQIAVSYNTEALTEAICDISKSLFHIEDQKQLLKTFTRSGNNIFHRAAFNSKNKSIFTTLVKCFNGILAPEEIKLMLWQKNFSGKNALHELAHLGGPEAFRDFFVMVQQILTVEDQKRLLTEEDNKNRNVLSFTAINSDKNVVKIFWEFAISIFGVAEQKQILTEKDKNRSNAFSIAVRFNNKEVIECLASFVQGLLNLDEQKVLFKSTNFLNNNIFHCAAHNKKHEGIFPFLWNLCNKVLTQEAIKLMLKQKTIRNNNTLHILIFRNHVKGFKELIPILNQTLTIQEQKTLITEKNFASDSNMVCFLALKSGDNLDVWKTFWDFIESIFSVEERKYLLLDTESSGQNILHIAARQTDKTLLDFLCNIISNVFNADEQKTLLQSFDKYGNNIFHFAAMNSKHEGIFSILLKVSQRFLTNDELKNIMQQRNHKREHIYMLARTEKNLKILKELLLFAEQVLPITRCLTFDEIENAKGRNLYAILDFERKEFWDVVSEIHGKLIDRSFPCK